MPRITPPADLSGSPMTPVEFRIARETLGLTGEALAGHLGVTPRTIRKWEHGASPVPVGAADEVEELLRQFWETVEHLADQTITIQHVSLALEADDGPSRAIARQVARLTGVRVWVEGAGRTAEG